MARPNTFPQAGPLSVLNAKATVVHQHMARCGYDIVHTRYTMAPAVVPYHVQLLLGIFGRADHALIACRFAKSVCAADLSGIVIAWCFAVQGIIIWMRVAAQALYGHCIQDMLVLCHC